MKRLPPDAFDHYVELGPDRSYDAVAKRHGVSKATVLRHAEKHRWQERLREAEKGAREAANKKAVDTLQAVKDRQLQEARILEHRALEALKTLPPEKASRAALMLQIAWKHELLLLGEPSERTELTIEEVTKREIQTLLIRDGEPDGWEGLEGASAEEGDVLAPLQPRAPRPPTPPPAALPTQAKEPPWRSGQELTEQDIVDDSDSE